ncbi:MAG: DinB family protein, partial [Alphaproteobacteria bacterium]
MTLIEPSISEASRTERQATQVARLEAVRAATLARIQGVDDALARTQVDPDFSPIGWHLGHIAFVEALWLLEDGRESAFPEADRTLWRPDILPRDRRGEALPPLAQLIESLAETRSVVLAALERPYTRRVELLISFVLQHETMHAEIISMLLALHQAGEDRDFRPQPGGRRPDVDLVAVPGGPFLQGNAGLDALDNERWPQTVTLPAFRIARHPTTQAEFESFAAAGGYDDRALWSAEGWAWRLRAGIR